MRSNRISRCLLAMAGVSLVCASASMAQTMGSPGMSQPSGVQQKPSPIRGMDDATTQMPGASEPAGMSQQQADKKFVQGALQGGMAEVELGKLALQKSSNEEVKKFAQRMVDDHTKLGEDMEPIAVQLGVKLPDGLSKKDQALRAKLQELSGAQFDKAYIHAMVKDHQKDLQEFKSEAQSAVNSALKSAAQKATPIIQSHLEQIEQIAKSSGSVANMASH
jgi:putative membrane protein